MSLLRITSRLLASSATSAALWNHCQRNEIHRYVMPKLRELRRRRKMVAPVVRRRADFIEWNYDAEIFAFGVRLKENFTPALLQQAFVDRSYIVQEEMKQRAVGIEEPVLQLTENTSLIKKGEELISKFTVAFLNLSLPKFPRDGIKTLCEHLSSDEVLANVSSHLGTKDLILAAEFPPSENTLAKTLKAIIGALEESSGEARAFEFIRDFVIAQLNQVDVNSFWHIENPTALLEEICKEKKLGDLEPRLLCDVGKNTILAVYQVGFYCNRRMIGSGFGEDMETATTEAALNSLRSFFGTNINMNPLNYKMPVDQVMQALKKPTVASAEKI